MRAGRKLSNLALWLILAGIIAATLFLDALPCCK